MHELYADKELQWLHQSKEIWLLKGGHNTAYFHRVTNVRKRKKIIYSLDNNGVLVEGTANILKHATD